MNRTTFFSGAALSTVVALSGLSVAASPAFAAPSVNPEPAASSAVATVNDQGTITADETNTVVNNGFHQISVGLTGAITPKLTGKQMGTYVLAGKFDAGVTLIRAASVRVVSGSATQILGVDTDYRVWVNRTLDGGSVGGDSVQIVMTASGLDKLAAASAADSSARVSVEFRATVDAERDGVADFTGQVVPSLATWTALTGRTTYAPASANPAAVKGLPTSTVSSRYGDAVVTLTAPQTAQFAVYAATSSTWKGTTMAPTASDCQTVTASSTPILTGLTTDASGSVRIKGLQQSNFRNSAQVPTGGTYTAYCLVQTSAPGGYDLQATPVAFTINHAASGSASTITVNAPQATTAATHLPLAKGGVATVGLGGLALLGGRIATLARRRRATLA